MSKRKLPHHRPSPPSSYSSSLHFVPSPRDESHECTSPSPTRLHTYSSSFLTMHPTGSSISLPNHRPSSSSVTPSTSSSISFDDEHDSQHSHSTSTDKDATSNPNPITPTHTRRFTRHLSQEEPDSTYLFGYFLLFSTGVMFVISMYAIVVSKYMPSTGNKVRKSMVSIFVPTNGYIRNRGPIDA
jgi:hypothetical protein